MERSILSYYADDGRLGGKESLVSHIHAQDWVQAEFLLRTDPFNVSTWAFDPHFYNAADGMKIEAKVLPHHIACQDFSIPVSFIKALQKVHAKGFLRPESSIYKRVPLHLACMNGASSAAILQMMKGQTEDCVSMAVMKQDALQRLPIHYACKHKHLRTVVEELVQVHPDSVMVEDFQGFLPIHVAARNGMPIATIKLLLNRAPGTVSAMTMKGSTPYMLAKTFMRDGDRKREMLALLKQYAYTDDCLREKGLR